jgi:hypothetical protein
MAGYSVFTKIVGEDGLSEVFRKVSNAATTAFKPVQAFNKAVGEPRTTALGKVGSAVDWVSGRFRAGLASISTWLPALGALGSAATLGGLIAMTHSSAEAFEGLTLSAEKLGVSVKDLAAWRYGAKMMGVEGEALDKGLVRLKKNLYDAATGKNKDVAALFVAMKMPMRDATGHVRALDSSLEDIAEAFKNTTDEEVKNRAALALFGKAGADLIPFLNKGRDGIRQWREEQERYFGLTKEDAENLDKLGGAYKHLDLAGAGLSRKLSAVFAPALLKVVAGTTDWIVANRDLIAQSLDHRLEKIGRMFSVVGEAAGKVASALGIDSWWRSADAATVVDLAFGALGITMAGPLFSALQLVTAQMLRMNLAMLRNPLVAGAVVAVGAAVEIVQHWNEVKQVFADAWKSAGLLGVAFEAINVPVNALYMAINGLTKALFSIDLDKWGDWFEGVFNRVFDAAIGKLERFRAWIRDVFSPVVSALEWVDRHTAPALSTAPAGYDGTVDNYRASFANRLPSNDPLAAAVNAAAPPQRLDVVLSGEVNVPPGSTIKATTKVGGQRTTAEVGYSMLDGI